MKRDDKQSINISFSLATTLSLDITQLYFDDLGTPITPYARVRDLYRGLLSRHEFELTGDKRCLPSTSFKDDHRTVIVSSYGESLALAHDRWIQLSWNGLEGEAWDWFAYRFAFGRWRNTLHNSLDDLFSLGVEKEKVLDLFEDLFRQPLIRTRKIIEELRDEPLSYWDSRVVRFGNYSFEDDPDDERESLSVQISLG